MLGLVSFAGEAFAAGDDAAVEQADAADPAGGAVSAGADANASDAVAGLHAAAGVATVLDYDRFDAFAGALLERDSLCSADDSPWPDADLLCVD